MSFNRYDAEYDVVLSLNYQLKFGLYLQESVVHPIQGEYFIKRIKVVPMFSKSLRFTCSIAEGIIPRGKIPVGDPERIARKDRAARGTAVEGTTLVRQITCIAIGEHCVFKIGGFGLQQNAKIRL